MGKREILVFNLAAEDLGLDISCVRSVLKYHEVHPLPQGPDFIEGVINLRGHIVAVIDLRKKFNVKITEDMDKLRIIICRIQKFIVGLIVDGVTEVINLSEDQIDPTPEVVSVQVGQNYLAGIARIGNRVIAILNLEEVLSKEDSIKLTNIKK